MSLTKKLERLYPLCNQRTWLRLCVWFPAQVCIAFKGPKNREWKRQHKIWLKDRTSSRTSLIPSLLQQQKAECNFWFHAATQEMVLYEEVVRNRWEKRCHEHSPFPSSCWTITGWRLQMSLLRNALSFSCQQGMVLLWEVVGGTVSSRWFHFCACASQIWLGDGVVGHFPSSSVQLISRQICHRLHAGSWSAVQCIYSAGVIYSLQPNGHPHCSVASSFSVNAWEQQCVPGSTSYHCKNDKPQICAQCN